ncbi:hypothetical protein [Bacillus infantis]|uniref:hypothetical protein n=1 Tax=Bacillus infantis TaxID=324767 RepID=UPI0020A121E6|nr:hypothetical protein [Bacillus infantis]MCP1161299.1 hypothetical protein [Bacillus infantis]
MWLFIQENIVGIIGILATAAVSIIIFFQQKKRKEISYEVLSSTSLLIHDESLSNRLKITIDDKIVSADVYLVLVRIMNTGNQPIRPIDFDKAITLNMKKSRYGITIAELSEAHPTNLDVKINSSSFDCIKVDPLLLNSKDEFTLKLLIPGYQDDLNVTSRIVGGQIKKYKKGLPLSLILFSIALILIPSLIVYFSLNQLLGNYFATTLSGAVLAVTSLSVISNLLSHIKKNLLKED